MKNFHSPERFLYFFFPHLRLRNDSLQISSLPPLLFFFFFFENFIPSLLRKGTGENCLVTTVFEIFQKKKRGKKRKVAYSQPIIYRNELHL